MYKDIICIRPLTSKYLWGKLRSNKNSQIENPLHFSYSVKRSCRRHTWLQSMSYAFTYVSVGAYNSQDAEVPVET